jgi:preprotein translocase subunit SecD
VSAPVPISVDPEFQALIPPLTHEEKTELENSLLREGCLDSIKVWKEGNILIDGHNRLDICTLHQIPYQLTYLSFPSRYAVVIWIITNQLGRRNVTKEQKSYLRGKRYEAEKKNIGGNYGNQYTKAIDQNDLKPNHTAENLAQEFNVSAPTIKRDAQFAKGVDLVGASNPSLRERILSGQANIPKYSQFTTLAKKSPNHSDGVPGKWLKHKSASACRLLSHLTHRPRSDPDLIRSSGNQKKPRKTPEISSRLTFV